MPFKSKKQQAFFNANKGTGPGKISPKVVDEFNAESKGMTLPEKAPKKPMMKPGMKPMMGQKEMPMNGQYKKVNGRWTK